MSKKELYESNHLIRWGITVGVLICTALIILFVFLNYTFFKHRLFANDWEVWILIILLAFFFTALICRQYIFFLANYLNRDFLKRFHEIKILGTFEEARPQLFNPEKKIKHAVLLLHGFTAAAEQLNHLSDTLKKAGIPFYAANTLGFGLNSTDLLEKVRCEDWFRQAIDTFDTLALFAEKISIVGHSMGGNLAAFIAQHRPVKHLILSAPAFHSVKRDLNYKNVLFTKGLSTIYSWVFPFLPKSVHNGRSTVSDILDASGASKTFHYMAVPVNSIKQFFRTQELVDLTKAQFETLTILHGKHDITIDNKHSLEKLRGTSIVFTEHLFENSAHNVLEDFDREKTCEKVLEILRST